MHSRIAAAALGACLALVALGLAVGAFRVYELERGELVHEGRSRPLRAWQQAPGSSRVSARLTELDLRGGEHAVFEVCTEDGLSPERWRDALGFAVFQLYPMRLMLRVELDAAHLAQARRNSRGACLQLGAGEIDQPGRYSVDAVWPDGPPAGDLLDVPVRARVLARAPLALGDRLLVGMVAAGCLLLLALAWLRPPAMRREPAKAPQATGAGDGARPGRRRVAWWTYLVVATALLGLAAASQLPLWGSTLGLSKGLLLAALQAVVALAWLYAGRAPQAVIASRALGRPGRPLAYLVVGLLACPLLVANARLSLSLVPSTGQAPIQTFISWPSGMLAFALVGAVLPMAEELFFRGFLYGALLPLGRWAAGSASVLAFAGLHAQQSWGNWGALMAILGTGVLVTGLRAASGSVLPGALAHVLYNVTLSLSAW